MANTMSIDQIKNVAEEYMKDPETEGHGEVLAWIQKQGKKVYPTAVESPSILLFMTDNGLVKVEDIDKYLVDISWIEWPAVIRRLIEYKKNPPPLHKKASAKKEEKPHEDPKKSWLTEKLSDGTILLKSYKGNATKVIVPDAIGKTKVTVIGVKALSPFRDRLSEEQKETRKKISEIVIPEGITTIQYSAFYGCESLKTVKLPASLSYIDDANLHITAYKIDEDIVKKVYAPADSYAEQYAKKYGISVINT